MSKKGWYMRGGVWCHRIKTEEGRRGEFRGYTDKTLSRKAYERELDRVADILYRRQTGKAVTSDKPILEHAKEYLTWGMREGGKNGHPWSPGQRRGSVRYLVGTKKTKGMLERMGVGRLDAITLHKFETALAAWENPKSRGIVGGVVKAFLNWCRLRKILAENPLEGWPGRKLEGDRKRRSPTLEEFEDICAAAPKERRLAYEFVFYAGARGGELDHLRVEMIRWDRGGIHIRAGATKARKEHFFRLPADYLAELREHVQFRHPKARVFDLSKSHKARYFHQDREAAEVPYETEEGFLDFHSLRHLFETILGYNATDSATELKLGRHTDMRTRKKYLHVFEQAEIATVEAMAAMRKRHNSATGDKMQAGK